MARAATTSDVFNAIAEPRRREILVLLRAGERPVTELAQQLDRAQNHSTRNSISNGSPVRDQSPGQARTRQSGWTRDNPCRGDVGAVTGDP